MHVTVKAMGALRPRQPAGPLELPSGSTIADVLDRLQVDPAAVQVCTVNGRIEHDRNCELADGDELVLLPPVGGG